MVYSEIADWVARHGPSHDGKKTNINEPRGKDGLEASQQQAVQDIVHAHYFGLVEREIKRIGEALRE